MASLTLGELLKKKAEDGVRVLLMIWGETTSIMGTHDTETENFFKGDSYINGFTKNLIIRKNLWYFHTVKYFTLFRNQSICGKSGSSNENAGI